MSSSHHWRDTEGTILETISPPTHGLVLLSFILGVVILSLGTVYDWIGFAREEDEGSGIEVLNLWGSTAIWKWWESLIMQGRSTRKPLSTAM